MTATYQAIETQYKGYRFRSRLEARWAVFFDTLGIEYQYEPQGFEKDGIRYLPDFYLVHSETWVEVKGSDQAMLADSARLTAFLDYGSPLPNFTDSDESTAELRSHGLLLLGDIPDPTKVGFWFHPIIRHYKGLQQRYAWFTTHWIGLNVVLDQSQHLLNVITGNKFDIDIGWSTRPVFVPTRAYYPLVQDAYRAARSARFEHGETP